MKDKWLKDLHDRMSGFEMDAPDNLWAEIEKEEIRRTGKHPKPVLLWVKRLSAVAAAAAVVLLTAYHVFTLMDVDNIIGPSDMDRNGGRGMLAQSNHVHENRDLPERNGASRTLPGTLPKKILAQEPSSVDSCGIIIASTAIDDTVRMKPDTDIIVNENPTEQPERMVKDTLTNVRQPDYFRSECNYGNLVASNSGGTDSRFSMSLYSSGGVSSNTSRRSAGDVMVSAGPDNAGWEDSPRLGILLFNQGMDITTDIKHRQPIRAGVSFTYKLNNRLGLGTGLSYTNLTSDIRSGSASHYFSGEQTLHYIGVPLNASYDVFRWKRIGLYASAGILAEKCVSGKVTTDFIVDDIKCGTETGDLHTKPFQFSVNAAAGIQLNITDMVGVYVEPGLSYYFDDGTDIKTIYKDKPLNLNLNFGLRFTIGQ